MSAYRENVKPKEDVPVKERKRGWKTPAALATICVVCVAWLICWNAYRWGAGVTLLIGAGWLVGLAFWRADDQTRREIAVGKRLEKLIELRSPTDGGRWLHCYILEKAADWIEKHK